MTQLNIGLLFDLRNPQFGERPHEDLVGAVLELVEEADRLGFGSVWTAEHHFTRDGDCASPLLFASAMAVRTSRIRIGTNLIVLPLHNPVRLAEDALFVSLLSRGRFDLGVGAGYVEQDFAAFGQRLSWRPSLMEEGIAVIRAAWAGESLAREGRRWTLPDVRVQPQSRPEHRPRLFVGGFAPPAIARAARLGDGFLCGLPATAPVYLEALSAEGRSPEDGQVVATHWWIVDEDPERTWARIGTHALYQVNAYIAAGSFGPIPPYDSPQALLDSGHYQLLDGPEAVAALRARRAELPQLVDAHFYGLLPGESVDSGAARMRYIAGHVVPAFRDLT